MGHGKKLGPDLAGVTEEAQRRLARALAQIAGEDAADRTRMSKALLKEYNIPMPNQNLTDAEMQAVPEILPVVRRPAAGLAKSAAAGTDVSALRSSRSAPQGSGRACGYCVEDKIASAYDHAVITRALERSTTWLSCTWTAPRLAARRWRMRSTPPRAWTAARRASLRSPHRLIRVRSRARQPRRDPHEDREEAEAGGSVAHAVPGYGAAGRPEDGKSSALT